MYIILHAQFLNQFLNEFLEPKIYHLTNVNKITKNMSYQLDI